MICGHCGHSVPDGSLTCEYCGTYLGKYSSASASDSGVRAIRQGRVSASSPTLPPRRAGGREYGDYDLSSVPLEHKEGAAGRRMNRPQGGSSRPDTRRGVPVNAYGRAPHVRHKPTGVHGKRRGGVNWMLIGLLCVVAVLAIGIGAAVYISRSDTGQRATARRNTAQATEGMFSLAASKDVLLKDEREALLKTWGSVSPQAYWLAGQDYLDAGEVEMAIVCLRIGDVVDPGNYDGLLLLANTYELNSQDDEAEALYLRLAKEVAPFRTEAYTALVRMYQTQGRRPEAADMMKQGYESTGKESFRLEREDYIPEPPQISLNAGRYQIDKLEGEGNVHLTSPQGYDIYYTTDDAAVLPQDGKLSTDGSFQPTEGVVNLRAVCVSGDLSSDEVKVSYNFYYPSPPAPQCNLAPNTYKSRREVKLRPGAFIDDTRTKKQKAEDEKHYRYYYTIDGSTPDVNSPVYDGTPIKLPSGKVKLKAICVNQYEKISAILEVEYFFNVKPFLQDMYAETDVFSGFVLNKTSLYDFQQTFGEPLETLDTYYLTQERAAKHLNYPWGYAVFALDGNAWDLVRVEMNRSIGNTPRGVGFGSSEAEITAVYKDFGQLQSPNGDRGLYSDYPDVGKVYAQADGSRLIQYTCQTAAGNNWVLQYWLQNDSTVKIVHYYQP